MKRRQFLKGMAAIATVVVAPFKREEVTTTSVYLKSPDLRYLRQQYRRNLATLYGGRVQLATGRQMGKSYFASINFDEIEKRVAADLLTDGNWHQYAQNSRGEMFFDGEKV